VAAGQDRDQDALEHGVLPDDDPLHLIERAPQRLARAELVAGGVGFGHACGS
jgi:hypothetical protein